MTKAERKIVEKLCKGLPTQLYESIEYFREERLFNSKTNEFVDFKNVSDEDKPHLVWKKGQVVTRPVNHKRRAISAYESGGMNGLRLYFKSIGYELK